MKFILLLVAICVFSCAFTRSHRRAKTYRNHSKGDLISCENQANVQNGLHKVDSFLKSFTSRPKSDADKFKEEAEVALNKIGCKFSSGFETLKDNIKSGFNAASSWVENLFKKKQKRFLETHRYHYGDLFTCSQ